MLGGTVGFFQRNGNRRVRRGPQNIIELLKFLNLLILIEDRVIKWIRPQNEGVPLNDHRKYRHIAAAHYEDRKPQN